MQIQNFIESLNTEIEAIIYCLDNVKEIAVEAKEFILSQKFGDIDLDPKPSNEREIQLLPRAKKKTLSHLLNFLGKSNPLISAKNFVQADIYGSESSLLRLVRSREIDKKFYCKNGKYVLFYKQALYDHLDELCKDNLF